MKLIEFMSLNGITREECASLIGVSVASVCRYLNGRRLPAPDVLVRIDKATGGAVTPNDFLLPAAARNDREAAE